MSSRQQNSITAAHKPAFMPVPGGLLQRACACGQHTGGGGECAACQKKREGTLQRAAVKGASVSAVPPVVHDVLRSSGQPLDTATRAFMEPRFGQDFSQVRVHSDAQAAESARAVHALAYTLGRDVVFGAGQYQPQATEGRRLMAHELTHTLQQDQSAALRTSALRVGAPGDAYEQEAQAHAARIGEGQALPKTPVMLGGAQGLQRQPASGGAPPVECEDAEGAGDPGGQSVERFGQDSAALTPAQSAAITTFVTGWKKAGGKDDVEVHGYASTDGPASHNLTLSCNRARTVRAELSRQGVTTTITLLAHGETDEFGARLDDNRRVIIHTAAPAPEPKPKCGPDATNWFVLQVNAALTDPAVLSIQKNMADAKALAAKLGTTTDVIAEAGAATAIERQEASLRAAGTPPPARSGAIVGQMAAGAKSQVLAIIAGTAAVASGPRNTVDFAKMGVLIGLAALQWKALVDHKARYDFKRHSDSMNHPKGASCPDEGCPPGEVGIITLCPGAAGLENCYESDLPGNIFYALIGRFIGWSELTLQLGSQLAELTDTTITPFHPKIDWDPPQDTAAISLGFRSFPLPLTQSALCSTLASSRPSLSIRTGCEDCLDPTPSKVH